MSSYTKRRWGSSYVLLLSLPLLSLACLDVDCGAGFCVDGRDGTYACVCMNGYEGDRCERPVPVARRSLEPKYVCTEASCNNRGTCIPFPSGETEMLGEPDSADESSGLGEVGLDCDEVGIGCKYTCQCVPGYTGRTCAIRKCVCVYRATIDQEVFNSFNIIM